MISRFSYHILGILYLTVFSVGFVDPPLKTPCFILVPFCRWRASPWDYNAFTQWVSVEVADLALNRKLFAIHSFTPGTTILPKDSLKTPQLIETFPLSLLNYCIVDTRAKKLGPKKGSRIIESLLHVIARQSSDTAPVVSKVSVLKLSKLLPAISSVSILCHDKEPLKFTKINSQAKHKFTDEFSCILENPAARETFSLVDRNN